jgi:Tyrosine-protein kinase ephrin type A/B receptor-like
MKFISMHWIFALTALLGQLLVLRKMFKRTFRFAVVISLHESYADTLSIRLWLGLVAAIGDENVFDKDDFVTEEEIVTTDTSKFGNNFDSFDLNSIFCQANASYSSMQLFADFLATGCMAGNYLDSTTNACLPCPVGTWSEQGKTTCEICPAGTKSFKRQYCKDCPAGKYSLAKSDTCKPCGAGEVSQPKASSCTACQPGKYADKVDNLCKACLLDTFSKGSANSCTPCPKGSYTGPGATECYTCNTGNYFDRSINQCYNCRKGYYTLGGTDACKVCPPNHYTPENPVFALPYGFCKRCNFVTTPDRNFCAHCPGGFKRQINAVDGDVPERENICVRCPDYQYSTGREVDDTKCYYCQGFVVRDQTYCEMEESTPPPSKKPTRSPTDGGNCRRGQEEVPVSPTNTLGCRDCTPSFYSPYPTIPCTKCPAGQISCTRETECRNCPPGQTADASQTVCIGLPTLYPTPYPTFDPTGNVGCEAGQYENSYTKKCETCQPGTFSPWPNQSCRYCQKGYYAPNRGTTKCLKCDDILTPDQTECLKCPSAYETQRFVHANGTIYKDARCVRCPKNSISVNGSPCQPCPIGQTAVASQTDCYTGLTSSPSFAPTPSPTGVCSPGSYFASFFPFVCRECSPSFYQESPMTKCQKCPEGLVTAGSGQTRCYECLLGTSPNKEQTSCR